MTIFSDILRKNLSECKLGFPHLWVSRQLSASVLTGDKESLHLADLRLQQEHMEMSCFRPKQDRFSLSFFPAEFIREMDCPIFACRNLKGSFAGYGSVHFDKLERHSYDKVICFGNGFSDLLQVYNMK